MIFTPRFAPISYRCLTNAGLGVCDRLNTTEHVKPVWLDSCATQMFAHPSSYLYSERTPVFGCTLIFFDIQYDLIASDLVYTDTLTCMDSQYSECIFTPGFAPICTLIQTHVAVKGVATHGNSRCREVNPLTLTHAMGGLVNHSPQEGYRFEFQANPESRFRL